MRYYKIHAYIRCSQLPKVEEALEGLGDVGFSFFRVKGIGEYANFFNPDHYVEHNQIEIFVHEDRVDAVVEAIAASAQTSLPGDGIVAVIPVERVVRIRSHADVGSEAS